MVKHPPRAHGLEAALDTPAKIYYKYESVSPSGSHKPTAAFAQAYYRHEITEDQIRKSLEVLEFPIPE